jgi:thiaminase
MPYQFSDLKKACPTEWQDYLFLIQFARAFALADVSTSRFEQLTKIFRDATRLEIDFWEMGLNLSD